MGTSRIRGTPRHRSWSAAIPLIHYCNDLPAHVTSQVRLFADDCLLYRIIKSEEDQKTLQQDLKLGLWASTLGMRFNPSKCVIMTIAKVERKRLHKLYTMEGVMLSHLAKDINTLEMIQRLGTRFVKQKYDMRSSVTSLLLNLQWAPLVQHK